MALAPDGAPAPARWLAPMYRYFESLIDPFRPHDESTPPSTLSGFYLRYGLQVWPQLVALMAIGIVISSIETFIVRFIGALVDLLRATPPEDLLRLHGGEFAAVAALVLVGRPIAGLMHDLVGLQALAPGMTNLIRWQTHHYVLRQSVSYFASDFAGRIASNIMQTGVSLRDSVVQLIDAMWFVLVFVTTSLLILGSADWRLAMPLSLWVVVYVGALGYFVPRVRRRSEDLAHRRATLTGRIVDSYANIQTVKLFAHLEREDLHAKEALAEHTRSYRRQTRLVTTLNLTVSINNSVLLVAETAICVTLWRMGAVSIGEIAVATGLAIRTMTMSMFVMWSAIQIFDNIGQTQEGMNTVSKPHALVDRPQARDLAATHGRIAFDHVRFHYGRDGGVFDDLNLSIAPWEKVGLVGRSGAGKSTLVNLLLRFYDLEGGHILIDGHDIAEARQDSLRQQIGMVTQDTSLLHRSILDNIRYGRPDASLEDVIEAAKKAHAHDYIADLIDPDGRRGYETLVGERGVKLSGGQRQRIAIARVLLKNAPILVLDEATSALDSEVEAAIQESLYSLMEGKTVIAIAHRLSTIAAMDRLIVLDRGEIVETGTHRELLERDRLYASLWRRQSGGFLREDAG